MIADRRKKHLQILRNTGFLTLILSAHSLLHAQTYFFDSYSVSDGLAQSYVYCIFQDSNHKVWLGSKSGVSVFDGHEFARYSFEAGLSPNGVQAIIQDHQGVIWLGHTGGGLTRYRNNKFERIRLPNDSIIGDITSILEDPDGSLWISTLRAGVIRILNPDVESQDLLFKGIKGNDLSDQVYGSYLGKDSSLYMVTDMGIKVYDRDSSVFRMFHPTGLTSYWTKSCIMEDSRGNFWFGTYNGGLYRYSLRDSSFKVYDIRDGLAYNWISALLEDRNGSVWVATWGGGITRITGDSLKSFNTSNGLQDDKIRCLLEDIEGNILVGTYEHGLSIFKGERFVSYGLQDGLIDQQIWAIHRDRKGTYWFGSNGGITAFNPGTKKKSQITHFNRNSHQLSSNLIRFIVEDKKENLWFGTSGGGIFQYIPDRKQFSFDPFLNGTLLFQGDLIVTAMVIDRKNQLWAGTHDGLVRFDIEKRTGDRGKVESLDRRDISSLFIDKAGLLWIGSRGKGLTRYDDRTGKFIVIHAFDQVTPTCMVEDRQGRLWVGTESQGVLVYKKDSIVLHLTEQDGLLANYITLITIDGQRKICMGTNKGLNIYDPESGTIRAFLKRSGFTGIETKDNAVFNDRDGSVWFGTVRGAIHYTPAATSEEDLKPFTRINSLQVNYTERPLKEHMRLSFNENTIYFDFYSVCLSDPDAVVYQVKLEGLEKDWEPVTTQSFVNYPPLPPGKYTFLLRARNAAGVWNDPPLKYQFQIRPPFYKTWWFILSCVGAGAALIFIYIRVRERALVHEKIILEEKVQERTQEVTLKNEELARINKDITDSIRYAERIQLALLPPDIPFDHTFVLYRPKAIVSGDFYWMLDTGEKQFMAAIDCTGHGVPGAFMSIIGYTSLNKIVREYRITEPGSILEHLNIEVTLALHQKYDQWNINDGMDVCLVSINKHSSQLEYAGAMLPLILMRDGQLTEIRGDRYSIGRLTGADKRFENHQLELNAGDQIYMFSDGFSDQFGGTQGKKFKSSRLKNLFLSIHKMDPESQQKELVRGLEEWMGPAEQNDDILIIGRRF
jgi:ligand-binding sensor domain-containing protein/serine phosphatase RsbU (regulator of sigma subunit)